MGHNRVSQGVAGILSDSLRTYLVNTNKFTIVTRENMEQVLKEQNFQMSGCTSQECIVQMGQLLGVRKMFAGSIGKVGATYVINLKIIDIESGKIEKAVTEQCAKCEEDALLTSITNIANKIIEIKPIPPVVSKPPVPKVGSYEVITIPDGADVYLDGELKGKTPLSLKDLPAGIHKAKISKEGYKDVESQFMIYEGKTTSKRHSLEKKEEMKPTEPIEKKFQGRFGLGLNWPGVQIRYGLTNSLMIEGIYQWGSQNNSTGGRLYWLFNKIPGNVSIFSYVGGAYLWVMSPVLLGGYITGSFGGAELRVAKNIGLGGDIGLYYVNMWSTLGSISDYGLIYNVGLTYYF